MTTRDPLWQAPEAHLERRFRVLGFDLRFATNHPAGMRLAERAFGRGTERAGQREIGLELIVRDDSVSTDREKPSTTVDAEFYRERGGLYVAATPQGEMVVANLEAQRGHAFAFAAGQPELQRRLLLESPVWRMAAHAGLIAVHAATVRMDGVTLVLRGPSGSGKSTLAASHALASRDRSRSDQALRHTGSEGDDEAIAGRPANAVISEEISWIDLRETEARIRGMPWTARLSHRTLTALGLGIDAKKERPRRDQKLVVDLGKLGCPCLESVRPGPVVFLARRPSTSHQGTPASARHAASSKPSPASYTSWRHGEDWKPEPGVAWGKLEPSQALDWMLASLEVPERTQRADGLENAARALASHGGYWLEVSEPDLTLRQLRDIASEHRRSGAACPSR